MGTSVVASSVAAPAIPAPLVLPGLPPAAVEALRSPPAGRYVYNVPVYISNSPLAMPSNLQRVLNFEPVPFTMPATLLQAPTDFGSTSPLVIPDESPSHSPLLPYGPTETPPASTSPLCRHGPTSPPSPVEPEVAIVMPLADARLVDILAISNGFEPRVKEEFDSEATISSDSSYTLGSDSSMSGHWVEYVKGTTIGMDMGDDFIDDSDLFKPL